MKKVWIGAAIVAFLALSVAWLYSGADERIERAERGSQVYEHDRALLGFKCRHVITATGLGARNIHHELGPNCSSRFCKETGKAGGAGVRFRKNMFLSQSCASKDYSYSKFIVWSWLKSLRHRNLWDFYVSEPLEEFAQAFEVQP